MDIPPETEAIDLYLRGNGFARLKHYDKALACYERAISIDPTFAEAHYNRGNALYELSRLPEALASYKRAVSAQPRHAQSHNNLGMVQRDLGRLGEASASFEMAIKTSPETPLFYFNLSTVKKFEGDDASYVAMRQLMKKVKTFDAADQIYLHFALGKGMADIGLYEESFDCFLAGNALKRQHIKYDESTLFLLFDHLLRLITPELINNKRGLGNLTNTPIFIVGMPRSGSTLVEQILASHPMVYGAGELSFFADALAASKSGDPALFLRDIHAILGAELNEIGTRYLQAIERIASGATRVTDKMPMNFYLVGLIHLALPNARIIHISRDAVDNCLSCFSTLFTTGYPFTYDLGELGRFYSRYKMLMQHWRNALPPGLMLEIDYEQLVKNTEHETRRLLTYCGLPWNAACLDFFNMQRPVRTASATQVRQPIYQTSMHRWRPSPNLLQPLIDGLER